MVIYDTELANSLETIGLPVYYEQIVDSTVKTPCITYMPMNNEDYLYGINNDANNLFYSKIDYYIKLWGHDKEELSPYAQQIDSLMKSLGFRRTSYHELATGTQVCLVWLYKATAYERT